MMPATGFEPDAQLLFNNAAALAFRFSATTEDAMVRFTPADYQTAAKTEDRSWLDNYVEVVEDTYAIVLAIEYAVKSLRCLGKGARATIDLSSDDIRAIVAIQMPPELRAKLREYDARLIRNQSVLIWYGLPSGVSEAAGPLNAVVVNPNWTEFLKGNMDPSPTAKVFDMEGMYGATTMHGDEVQRIFETLVHVEDLFAFLATIFKPLVEQARTDQRFAGQGYTFVREEDLIKYVVDWAHGVYADCFNEVFQDYNPGVIILECFTRRYWEEVAPRLLHFISHDFASRESIDWQLFRATRFLYRCDDGTVFFHLGSVIHFLAHLWDGFQPTGDFANIKGRLFERVVLNAIESVEGFARIWEPSCKLNFPVEGKVGTDVDVFVRRKELAFLISCKSYSVNGKYELGEGQTFWDRSATAKSWFRFAHNTATAIAAHHQELRLPPELRGICPLVCTGWPEYLFEPSREYFMEDGTPRIATVSEIRQFFQTIDDTKAEKLLRDHWIVHIPFR
jgi:hypothetical protein